MTARTRGVIASVALIGFGEAGSTFARDLARRGLRLSAYDPLFATPSSPAARALRKTAEVRRTAAAAEAASGADLVVVAVTAGSDLDAIASLTGALGHAPFVLDINSVSPGVKRSAAEAVSRMGGRFVEAAVMSSIPPTGLATPMLFGGPYAEAFLPHARALGLVAEVFSSEVGRASSVKMCRSLMVKGLEALFLESLLAARHYGVEAEVLASLSETVPGADWPALARYMVGRAARHGRRRAEEMREVAITVGEAGLKPLLSSAVAERQDWAAQIASRADPARLAAPGLVSVLDALNEAAATSQGVAA